MSVVLNTKHLSGFINEEEYKAIYPQVEAAHRQLEAKNGPGNDFLGWMYLPRDYDKEEFARIKEAAQKIREDSEVLVVAGIGGSYLGARAVIEAVKGLYHNEIENGLKIYFCGNSISPTYLNDIIALCKGKKFSINVISKSGTTTETSLAFRVLRKLLEDEMGVEEANKRIYATTDRAKGTLKQLADAQGWPTFVVPDDVGGRYSVLSAVGLLPIAAAGIDIDELTDVWEASVRKTHDFLNEHEILLYRQAVHDRYLVTLSPFGIRIGKTIAAFCAVQDETIEMLFVAPEHQGRGLGSRLLDRAIQELRATRVDVNEQNRPAKTFYLKRGFRITGRDEFDPHGIRHPILHLSLHENLPPSGSEQNETC